MDRFQVVESFVRVAHAGSFTKAAMQLGLSRAMMSRRIMDLEARLGVRLLNRSTRRVTLTEEGRAYLAHCEKLLSDLETAEREVARSGRVPLGTIRILAPKSFGVVHLADAVIAFCDAHPQIRVSLSLSDFTFRPNDFVDEGFDVAIRIADIRDSAVLSRRIATMKWVLCASPDFLRRKGAPRSVADLARYPCLAHLGSDEHDRVWHFIGPGGGTVRVDGPFHSNSALALRKAALAGLGIALAPEYCIGADLDAGTLVRILPQCTVRHPVIVLYVRSHHVPKKVRLFVEFLAKWLKRAQLTDPPGKPSHAVRELAKTKQSLIDEPV
jgi:DNA-binding transcriptional LysR family regulator